MEDGRRGCATGPAAGSHASSLFCRSGLPFTAKSVTGARPQHVYKPIICTPEALDALSGRSSGRRRLVDVRTELLPLLFAEMYSRYYAQVAFQASGSAADGAAVREQLARRGAKDRFDDEAGAPRLALRQLRCRGAVLRRTSPSTGDSDEYERFVYQSLADDLREAEVPDGASPVKSAAEVFRIFRDWMRSVVELGGLSLDSYLDFNADICSRIHRLVAGPPALRTRQMMALMDAGVVRMPYGPAPAMGLSVRRGRPVAARTRHLLDGV